MKTLKPGYGRCSASSAPYPAGSTGAAEPCSISWLDGAAPVIPRSIPSSRCLPILAASEQPRTRLCMACFDGQYPIKLPDEDMIGKHLLEGLGPKGVSGDAEPVLPTGYGAEDALRRP